MADLEKLEKEALKILEKKSDIYFFQDLADELGYSRQWLYELGLDKLDTIKSALLTNKQTIKRGLRNKWYKNDNPTVQVALYRLLADEEELKRLNTNSKMEVTGANGEALIPTINILPIEVKNGNSSDTE
ncbi:MAG: hypothetical protein UE295_05365 [Acutalibacteraceae bacterium]|nr:hypothetical protein [Acutalibacteraceae bacterium]